MSISGKQMAEATIWSADMPASLLTAKRPHTAQ